MIHNGKKLAFSSARRTNNSYEYEVSSNHTLLHAREEHRKTLRALHAKKEVLEQELAELAGCAKLTRAQQDLMQSLKQRIALLSETLTKAR